MNVRVLNWRLKHLELQEAPLEKLHWRQKTTNKGGKRGFQMLHFYAYLNFWDHPQHNCEYDMTMVPCWSISPGVSGVPNVDASVVQEQTGWGAVLHGIVGYCRILWGIVWSCPRGEREWGSTNNPSVDNQIKCTVVLRVNVCMLDGDGWGEVFPQPSIMAMQSEKKDLRKSRQNIKRSLLMADLFYWSSIPL